MSGRTDFYRAFEDRHRGSRETIQARLGAYLPFLRPLAQLHPHGTVVDLGCGRGEWMELVVSQGLTAQGVDLDEGMLLACRERGLDVRREDALAFLKGLPDGGAVAVSAFHLAEHLPFDDLQSLVSEALRVLRPGGLLILETPNPENLVVGSSGFYMDPTHQRPLPPLLLAFLPEFHGFARVKTLRLQEGVKLGPADRVELIDVLAGVSPDYAVIAQKRDVAGENGAAPAQAAALLEAAFAQGSGVTLNQLAHRYDDEWNKRLREVQVAAELARAAALAAQADNRHALERSMALEERMLAELRHARRELDEVYRSRSWRVTWPLRWGSAQVAALRQQGPVERVRRLARKAVADGPRLAMRALNRFPRVRRFAGQMARAAGLGGFIARARTRFTTPMAPPPATPSSMTPEARRVHEALKHALATQAARHKQGDR